MSVSYEKARRDFEELREIATEQSGLGVPVQVNDFTGGFVFEVHAWALLERPTKQVAARLYEKLIIYSAQAGWDRLSNPMLIDRDRYPRADEIYGEYGE